MQQLAHQGHAHPTTQQPAATIITATIASTDALGAGA
jgi:hypothetical protein